MNFVLETLQHWPAQLLAPGTLRLIALALLHFLWQGAVLAAAAYAAMALCRSAAARYVVAVAALTLMAAAPLITFKALSEKAKDPSSVRMETTPLSGESHTAAAVARFALTAHSLMQKESARPDYLLLLVEMWFAGVLLLSLRSAGGFLLVERLRRRSSSAVPDHLLELCLELQDRLRLRRFVRYSKCALLNAPAVAGWLRPVVLIPASAISGLTTVQLRAVIAHELAHIRRFDAFVNLFQIGVETLLFYHPAVWWLGKRIRAERENCCDDIAVTVCGSPLTYAHALAYLANSKVAPRLAMAANRGPLATRVARLLNADATRSGLRSTGLSAAAVCLSSAIIAATALVVISRTAYAAPQDPPPTLDPAPVDPDGAFVVRPTRPVKGSSRNGAPAIAGPSARVGLWPALAAAPQREPAAESQAAATAAPAAGKSSYIDAMKAAGYDNLSVDDLIALKVQGVTPEYIRQMKDLGLHPSAEELIGLKVQGVTPDYVREMRAVTGAKIDTDGLIGLKVQGVTPEYVKQMKDLGAGSDPDEIIGLKVQGVTADYIHQMKDLGLRADAENIIGMKVQGITPEYVKNMRGLGLKVDSDDVIGLKVQGVTPEYIKSINELGLHPDTESLIGMKVQGVTAEYLKTMQAAGFKLDVDDAIGAKVQGITPEFIEKARAHGFKNLTLDQLMALKHAGVLDPQQR
jgi:beta-lactamase regulating signal transducer with metallopeptidase domain